MYTGIQTWSRGEFHPFTIVMVENYDTGMGRIYGQSPAVELAHFHYKIGNDKQFSAAHRMAEASCRHALRAMEVNSQLEMLENLTGGVFVAPSRRLVPAKVWDEIMSRCGS